mmetsp:Transcript_6015/g.9321  ORF Transcript_6015/g.9321 Transcript_6015/m.9321 type:complete len:266 (+) Transcript_6015:555-1352(+)
MTDQLLFHKLHKMVSLLFLLLLVLQYYLLQRKHLGHHRLQLPHGKLTQIKIRERNIIPMVSQLHGLALQNLDLTNLLKTLHKHHPINVPVCLIMNQRKRRGRKVKRMVFVSTLIRPRLLQHSKVSFSPKISHQRQSGTMSYGYVPKMHGGMHAIQSENENKLWRSIKPNAPMNFEMSSDKRKFERRRHINDYSLIFYPQSKLFHQAHQGLWMCGISCQKMIDSMLWMMKRQERNCFMNLLKRCANVKNGLRGARNGRRRMHIWHF